MSSSCIDLFAGCGGLSLGLANAGFSTLFCVEAHPDAFATYERNLLAQWPERHQWPGWLEKRAWKAQELLANHYADLTAMRGKVDLIAGGPPCQGFSTNGLRRPDDPRSQMVDVYLRYVEVVQPRLVLLENVVGFHSMKHRSGSTYSEYVVTRLKVLGYDVWSEILKAADWGVAQKRPRFILVGALKGSLPGIDPLLRLRVARKEFLAARGLKSDGTSAQEALSDLEAGDRILPPDPEWGSRGFKALVRQETASSPYQVLMRTGCDGQPTDMRLPRHSKVATERMRTILESCKRGVCISPADRSRLGIKKRSTTPLSASNPAPTITTLPDDLIHYSEARAMSVREHARLQSFPDWFAFQGPYTTGGQQRKLACPRFTQVGNAVPPLLAEALGEMLLGLLRVQRDNNSVHLSDRVDVKRKSSSDVGEVLSADFRTSLQEPTALASDLNNMA